METLKGKKIIERIHQLMNYGKSNIIKVEKGRNWPSLEYSIKAPNGKTYGILREQTKFYIKESTIDNPTVQDFEFIGGVINGSKRYYKSFSGALNYLNLMIAEMNKKNPKAKNINLLECGDKSKSVKDNAIDELKDNTKEKEINERTVLKVPKQQSSSDNATEPPVKSSNNREFELDNTSDDSSDEVNLDDLFDDEDNNNQNINDEDTLDTDNNSNENKKEIQRLTGKLGQKLRELDQQDPDLTKYVINSVISALDLQNLEDKDQKQILKKIKKKMSNEEKNDDEIDIDTDINLDNNESTNDDVDLNFNDNNDERLSNNKLNLPRKNNLNNKNKQSEIQEINTLVNKKSNQLKHKINETIRKYFEISPKEKEEQTNQFLTETINKVMLLKEGKSKCKTLEQAWSLAEVLDYDNGFSIKTMNENIIIDTNHRINLGGKDYAKLIMIETNGKVSGILKDMETKLARQYRMENKNDYLNFIKLGN